MKLKDICEINPRTLDIEDDTEVSFIPMPSVFEDGKIDTSDIRLYADVKKGYTTFKENDVLFAKITPCMENGKGAVARGLKNGYGCGSSEFHVLRATEQVIPEWLYYLTAWDRFRKEAEKHMTGSAGQRRVPKQYLENYVIDLPSLNDQEQQIQVLSQLQLIIDYRKEQMKAFDELIKARFVELFGDPVHNEKGWVKKPLKDVCTKLNDGTHFSPESFEAGDYKYVTAKNIKANGFDFSNITYVPEEVHRPIYERCNPEKGDVLYIKDGVTTGIAMVNTLDEEFTLLSSVALLKQNRALINGYFLCGVLNNNEMYSDIRSNMGGAAITRLTIAKLNTIQVIVPPIRLQDEFSDFVKQVNKSKVAVQKSLNETQKLFDSLMQEYFG